MQENCIHILKPCASVVVYSFLALIVSTWMIEVHFLPPLYEMAPKWINRTDRIWTELTLLYLLFHNLIKTHQICELSYKICPFSPYRATAEARWFVILRTGSSYRVWHRGVWDAPTPWNLASTLASQSLSIGLRKPSKKTKNYPPSNVTAVTTLVFFMCCSWPNVFRVVLFNGCPLFSLLGTLKLGAFL